VSDYQERRCFGSLSARFVSWFAHNRFLIGLPTGSSWQQELPSETNIMGLRLVKKIGLHARIDE
jgi:hypothetical protein